MPAVTPQPVTPTYPGNTTWDASAGAMTPVSGQCVSSTACSDVASAVDYCVETQTYSVDFFRVPYGQLGNWHLSLSSVSSINFNFNGSRLLSFVNASYSKTKVHACFCTSTYSQPQKFIILGNQYDYQGNQYGTLDASTLGPAGTVATSQPFYSRRPWDATIDVAVSKQMYGAGHYCVKYDNVSQPSFGGSSMNFDQTQYTGYEESFIWPPRKGAFVDSDDIHNGWSYGNSYMLQGPYTTEQENIWKYTQYMNSGGASVRNLNFFSIPPTAAEQSGTVPTRLTGIAEYDENRHDYS